MIWLFKMEVLKKKINKDNNNNIKKFDAIRDLSHKLVSIDKKKLSSLSLELFADYFSNKNPIKSKKIFKYFDELKEMILPLGKNNLAVLSSLLLLNHFALEKNKKKNTIDLISGGSLFNSNINKILKPFGVNQIGSSKLLIELESSFNIKKDNVYIGGNPLKDLIAPLGTSAFIATGLLVILENYFVKRVKEINNENKINNNNETNIKNNSIKKINIKKGVKKNKDYEELVDLLSPLTFNIFAKESFLKNFEKYSTTEK